MEKFSESKPCNHIFLLNISGSAFESSFSFAGIDEINRIPSPTEILERNTSPDSGVETIDVEHDAYLDAKTANVEPMEFTDSAEPKTAVEAIKGKTY